MLNSKGGAMKVKVSSGCLLLMLGQVSRLIQFSSLLTQWTMRTILANCSNLGNL